jgi:hypothetical protein
MAEDSSSVVWTLLKDGEIIEQSSEIMDCVRERDGNNGQIKDGKQPEG